MNTNKEVNKQEEREYKFIPGKLYSGVGHFYGTDKNYGMQLSKLGTGYIFNDCGYLNTFFSKKDEGLLEKICEKEQPASQSSIDTGGRFKNWLEERIESYNQEKEIHGDKERIKARLSMLNETLENYNRWTANPPIDTGVEAEESGDLFIHIASGQVHECIGTDEKKIWYVPDGEMESKSFLPEECRLLTPAEKYVLTVYDTKYPQMADKEIKAFIAGAKWASSGEAVEPVGFSFAELKNAVLLTSHEERIVLIDILSVKQKP